MLLFVGAGIRTFAVQMAWDIIVLHLSVFDTLPLNGITGFGLMFSDS